MKTQTILAALALMGVMLAAPLASANHPLDGDYLIGATPGLSVTFCDPELVCIGGHIFQGDLVSHTPVGAFISDASGGDVDFTVCQDFNGALCGEAGEPRVDGCGSSANLGDSEVPFVPGTSVAVFIRIWHPDCPANVATSGTVTITTSG